MPEPSWFTVRGLAPGDAGELEAMIRQYMSETYQADWHGTVDQLTNATTGPELNLAVAERATGELIGFVAWSPSYDVHHCTSGGTILDLFVTPSARGRAVALMLLCRAADEIRRKGGVYLQGGAVDSGSGRRLYERSAVCEPGLQCTISGRAFTRFAQLADADIRHAVLSLPDPTWNFEAP